jgi:hypothetical protein
MREHLSAHCGLVSADAACGCPRRVGATLDCVEVLAHGIVDGAIVRSYHRPDQHAIDAFFS